MTILRFRMLAALKLLALIEALAIPFLLDLNESQEIEYALVHYGYGEVLDPEDLGSLVLVS